jgi:histidine ammonia-lyase
MSLILDGNSLTVAAVVEHARHAAPVTAAPGALAAMAQSRAIIDRAVARGETMYGINTGFGKLANVRIAPEQLDRLQVNLIRSHAAGTGPALPPDVVRAMMLLRANVLLRPTSGVRPALAEALVALLNSGLLPWVPEQGSVGASGDLAPLAHLALVLMGEGQVLRPDGQREETAAALARAGLVPFHFAPKEGLSFINGTQAQTALLALLVDQAEVLWRSAVGAAAMSLEAWRGTPTPLDARIHDHLNASTDNPLVLGEGEVLSGGNFHGQPVAQALDFLAIALTTLQALSERRIERLVNPDLSQGLPAFLTRDPGLSSGHMMVQITAASLVAESRTLAYPASIGSIPTDANQEDFVPMGMAAASKARRILANAECVVGAEFLCAAQGLEFLRPLRAGGGVEVLHRRIREMPDPVAPLGEDRPPAPDLERLARAVRDGELDPWSASGR